MQKLQFYQLIILILILSGVIGMFAGNENSFFFIVIALVIWMVAKAKL